MAGHSRSKASLPLAYDPAIHDFISGQESKTWITGTSPVMTIMLV